MAACQPAATPPPTEPAEAAPTQPPPEEEVNLRYMTAEEGAEEAATLYDGVRAQFTEEYPSVQVTVERVPYSELLSKWMIESAAGTPIDIMTSVSQWQRTLSDQGSTLILDELIESEGFPIDDLNDHNDIQRAFEDPEGHVSGFDYEMATSFVFYLPELLDAAGVKPPGEGWTMYDLLEAAQALTIREGDTTTQWGFGNVFGTHWSLDTLLMSNGTQLIAEDLKTPLINSPEAVEVIQFWQDLRFKHKVIPTQADYALLQGTGQNWMQGIWTGNVAMGFTQPVQMLAFRKYMVDHEFLIGEPPMMSTKGAALAGSGYTIGATTKYPLEAFWHIAFLVRPDVRLPICYFTGEIPSRRSARDVFFQETGELPPANLDVFEDILKYAKCSSGTLVPGKSTEILDITVQRMSQIWDEGKPVEPVLDQVQKEIEEVLASA